MKIPVISILVIIVAVALWALFGRAERSSKRVAAIATPQPAASQTKPEEARNGAAQPNGGAPIPAIGPDVMTVDAGGLSLPLVFQNPHTAKRLKQLIIRDLNLIYGHLDGAEILKVPQRSVSIAGTDQTIDSIVNYTGKGRYTPDSIQDSFGRIVEIGGLKHLFIGPDIEAAYAQAQALTDANPQVFDSFESFLVKLNSIETQPLENIKKWFQVDGAPADVINDYSRAEIVDAFGRKIYRRPSLLDFNPPSDKKEQYKDAWTAQLYIMKPSGVSDSAPTAIYIDGAWKLLLSPQSP